MEINGQQLRLIVLPDSGGLINADGGQVFARPSRRVCDRRRVDGVEVHAHVVPVDISVLRVEESVELHRNEPGVAGTVGEGREEAKGAPVSLAWAHRRRREMPEEEGHPVTDPLRVVLVVRGDLEGEGGGEARSLARGSVPQRHALHVRRPANTVRDVCIESVSRQLERRRGDKGMPGARDRRRLRGGVTAWVGEVEAEG